MQNILIINSAPLTLEFIKPLVELFTSKKIKHKPISFNEIPKNLDDFSHIIISASPKGDDIIHEQVPIYQWIREYNKPILGSCHGHQLLGVLYGSNIIIGKECEEGFLNIRSIENDPIFSDIQSSIVVEQHHVKSISLPNDFKLLASSEKCKVQLMKHKEKPFYGCQFHIESRLDLVMNFVELSSN
ncbi:MAG: hypothetical protein PF517_16645 [Salinivirgaceae bacterium]|jgi:GMP synthase-like glutamine amidotransferase|nr:hypothetical protein [Salinivirgaceae bacterium]